MYGRLKRQMDFILEIDKLKDIKRQTYLSNGKLRENDAEHSWHLAMMVLLLSEYSNEKIDVLKTMSMVLIHDIIEIDAGDTYAYDNAGNDTKSEREKEAADRLFNILPEDQAEYMYSLWREFEERKTPESLFASCLDRVQPTMLNNASGGKSWEEHGISISQIVNRNGISKKGSEKLWNFARYNYLEPGMLAGNIYNDYEDFNMARYELATARIADICNEENELSDSFTRYFKEMAKVITAYRECNDWIAENNKKYLCDKLSWYKEIPLETWKQYNEKVTSFRYDKKYYETSFANPDVAVESFGPELGKMLSAIAARICSLGHFCFEERFFEITIETELLLEIYDIILTEGVNTYEGSIKSAIYYHSYDYMEELTKKKVRESLDSDYSFFTDIVIKGDISDEKMLYLSGEHISSNEIEAFRYINTLSEEEIEKIASTYIGGFVKYFKLAGIDLAKKETAQIRYPVGMERIIKKSIEKLAEHGLKPLILRGKNQTSAIDTNPQFDYDHRFDHAIYYNKAVKERKLKVLKKVYDKYADMADVFAGPAVIEFFGEESFDPVSKKTTYSLDEKQQSLSVEYSIEASTLVNNYIKRDSYGFTIIAFPLPAIGNDYSKIFSECVRINTLDEALFSDIQQNMIDVLDKASYVRIKGSKDNETDLVINLTEIKNPQKESLFHNCLADCNIPVGEVYTSPKLEGTHGLLNVKKVYINGLEYRNLKIEFEEGMTKAYSCDNYEDKQLCEDFVRDNLMKQHKSLPMGEFAIGTNTAAYKMGKDYDIADKLPILIAEKTGPHIAIGDTCFSMSEDIPEYNPDGKEVIARDNSISLKRHSNVNEAYFGCHTDITIAYNEIGSIAAVDADGNETLIIKDGRFVLQGTTKLNDMM